MMVKGNSKGYTLVELAIAVAVLSLILSSGLSIFGKKRDAERIKITNERIAKIEAAIMQFVDVNGYIPCPSPSTDYETSASFGDSADASVYNAQSHTCTNSINYQIGMVPVRNLGLEDEYAYDGWERKFTFSVANGMGNSLDFADPNFPGNNIAIVDLGGGEKTNIYSPPLYSPSTNNYGAAYVIVSHGPDGLGAYGRNYPYSPSLPATTSPEYQNAQALWLSYLPSIWTFVQDSPGYTFNDIVAYKRKIDLIPAPKAISPFRIPNLTCSNASAIVSAWQTQQCPLCCSNTTCSTSSPCPSSTGTCNASGGIINGISQTNSGTPNYLAQQIYLSALNIQKLCQNQPPSSTYSNSSCLATPVTIQTSGLQAWYDGSDPLATGVAPTNNSSVSAPLSDKSGNGNNLTAGGGATYTTNTPFAVVAGTSTNRGALAFNFGGTTSQNFYTSSGFPSNFNNSSYTIFVVEALGSSAQSYLWPIRFWNYSSNCAYRNIWALGYDSINNGTQNIYSTGYTTGGTASYVESLVLASPSLLSASSSAQSTTVAPRIWVASFDTAKGMSLSVREIDGTVTQGTNAFTGSSAAMDSVTAFGMGVGDLCIGGHVYTGYIGEVILYNTILSMDAIKQIEGYLARKWFSGECP